MSGKQTWGYSTPIRKPQWPPSAKATKPKKQMEDAYVGYDGRKVQLQRPEGERGSSSHGASSASGEIEQWKSLVKELTQDRHKPLTAEQQEMLQDSPGTILKLQQKELNGRRKKHNKMRNLKQKYQENEQSFKNFVDKQKLLLKQEKERYLQEKDRLERQIVEMEKASEAGMDTDEEIDDLLTDKPIEPASKDPETERRLANAERTAYEMQQGFLELQANMQQFTAYQMQQMANPMTANGHTGRMDAPPTTVPPAASQSPQMPKPVRATKPAGTTDVKKNHLKDTAVKEKDKAPKDVKATSTPAADVVEVPDDDAALL